MNLSPFLEYAEPETFTYRITHKDGVTELPYKIDTVITLNFQKKVNVYMTMV